MKTTDSNISHSLPNVLVADIAEERVGMFTQAQIAGSMPDDTDGAIEASLSRPVVPSPGHTVGQ